MRDNPRPEKSGTVWGTRPVPFVDVVLGALLELGMKASGNRDPE